MNLHLAQINPTVGDMACNQVLITRQIGLAGDAGADLVVFPELCVTGYYPRDLLLEPGFMERVDHAVRQIVEMSRGFPRLTIVIGAPRPNPGAGKAFLNALLVIQNGAVVLEYHKQLLPTYGVFDELRHFEPGRPNARTLQIAGKTVGFLICEDIWNFEQMQYMADPVQALQAARPDVLVSINASPSHVGKRAVRHELGKRIATTLGAWLVYVNQVGGQDELVYDGSSFVMSPAGAVVAEAQRFESQTLRVERVGDGEGLTTPTHDQDLAPEHFYTSQIVLGLRDYMRHCGFSQVLVGSSGGIDSAVTIALSALALGPDNVKAITMPSRFSSSGSVDDSELLCRSLGVELFTHPIVGLVDRAQQDFERAFTRPGAALQSLTGVAQENLQARLRAVILMAYSNQYGPLMLTTGNKSEISVGFYTLGGDSTGGLNLIGDLYKTEVYAVARALNDRFGRTVIPANILDKPPSAELAPGQRDVDALPPYDLLDLMLRGLVEFDPEGVAFIHSIETGGDRVLKDHLANTRRRLAQSEYKRRQAAPIIRVRPRAFGAGRQIPLTAKVLP